MNLNEICDELYGEIFLSGGCQLVIQCTLCPFTHSDYQEYLQHVANLHNFPQKDKTNNYNGIEEENLRSEDSKNPLEAFSEESDEEQIRRLIESDDDDSDNDDSVNDDDDDDELEWGDDNTMETESSEALLNSDIKSKENSSQNTEAESEKAFYFCSTCDAIDGGDMKNHVAKSYCIYECGTCKKKTSKMKHIMEHHIKFCKGKKVDLFYKCPVCDGSIKGKPNYNQHLKRHYEKNRKYECTGCGKKFFSSTELKSHLRSHTKEKPYLCPDCGAAFSFSGHYHIHLRAHRDERNYKCDICGRAFLSSKNLKNHMAGHSSIRNFKCTECDSAFTRQTGLKQHMKIHENKQEYECPICGSRFNQRPGLNSHLKVKHGNMSNS